MAEQFTFKRPELVDPSTTLANALSYHQSGQLSKARIGYQSVLALEPNNFDALHLLGVLENQTGQPESAIVLISHALKLKPDFAEAQNSLGNVYKEMKNWIKAEAAYNQAIAINPRLAGAHLNLGLVARQRGDLETALVAYETALNNDPTFALAYFNKANALQEMGSLIKAVETYHQALSYAPDLTDAQKNLGLTLYALGDHYLDEEKWDAAVSTYNQAIASGVNNAALQNNLGTALQSMERFAVAMEAFRSALSFDSNYAAAHNNLGTLFDHLGEFEAAVECYRHALNCDPDFIAALNNLGNGLRALDQVDEAIEAYKKALKIEPSFLDAQFNLGHAYKELGDFDRAKFSYKRVLELAPDHPQALRQLASLGAFTRQFPGFHRVRKMLDGKISDNDRAELAFALAKVAEEEGRSEEMFAMLMMGNTTRRHSLTYDPIAEDARFEAIAKAFSKEIFANIDPGFNDTSPIFIIGMPRSGTSLVEQIIASHPDVYGAGELTFITNLAEGIGFPETVAALSPSEWYKLGERYTKQLKSRGHNKSRIVDKMPQNFLYLGFIRMILPKAKIIHCTRSPEDTCLSLFKTLFTDRLDFAYDLSELGSYYGNYAKLMEHWRKIMPNGFLDLSYESLIKNQKYQTQRLLSYLELPWNDACLNFHNTDRRVTTASTTQVRRELYTGSVGIWRQYKEHLTPLFNSIPSEFRSID